MSRLIDANAFEEFIIKNCNDSLVDLWCELVRRQPTIEAVPVVHGHWSRTDDLEETFMCSVCGYDTEDYIPYNFCPNCGADMQKGGGE